MRLLKGMMRKRGTTVFLFSVLCVSIGFLGVSLLIQPVFSAEKEGTSSEKSGQKILTLSPVVVTATRIKTPLGAVGHSVSVLTFEDIEKAGIFDLPRAMATMPGFFSVQTGGFGGQASVFVRGGEAHHTKLLLDGMDIADPSTPTGAADFSNFFLDGIEQVEAVRGPQSSLYGSNALAGVVNLIPREGKGPPRLRARVEGGSFETLKQSASLEGSSGNVGYVFGVTHGLVGAQSVTPPELFPQNARYLHNRAEQTGVHGRLSIELAPHLVLKTLVRYGHKDFQYVTDTPSPLLNTDTTETWITRTTLDWEALNGRLKQTFGFGYVGYDRLYTNAFGSSAYQGDRLVGDWQATFAVSDIHTLVLGTEYQREKIGALEEKSLDTLGGFIALHSTFSPAFSNTLQARVDHTSHVGVSITYRISPTYLIARTRTRLKASIGTGFKAPTLSQLYMDFPPSFYGNRDLKPERTIGGEFGVTQTLWDGKITLDITSFYTRYQNLIDVNDTFTSYQNRYRTEAYGIETSLAYRIMPSLLLRVGHVWTVAHDLETDRPLRRRPAHTFNARLAWSQDAFSLFGEIEHAGSWWDAPRPWQPGSVRAAGYTAVTFGGDWRMRRNMTLYGRIENAFDAEYESPLGYRRPRFGVFMGIRLDLGGEETGAVTVAN